MHCAIELGVMAGLDYTLYPQLKPMKICFHLWILVVYSVLGNGTKNMHFFVGGGLSHGPGSGLA